MSLLKFAPAKRSEAKARVALLGPTGAGKTHTALEWATVLADGGSVAVIDTENASASLYADKFDFVTAPWWPPYDATKLAAAIKDAAGEFDVLVLDSLTHFWAGDGGVLDIVDREAAKNRGNTYTAWKKGTPIWRGLLDALIFAPCHVVVTMRSKMDHVLIDAKDSRDGRARVEKVGMAPQARNDVEYEFTIVGELDQAHTLTVTKSRCSDLADQVAPAHQAGGIAKTLRDWLASADGTAATAPPVPEPQVEADPNAATEAQIKKMAVSFKEQGIVDRDRRLAYINSTIDRTVTSSKELTKAEASKVIELLEANRPARDEAPPTLLEEPPR